MTDERRDERRHRPTHERASETASREERNTPIDRPIDRSGRHAQDARIDDVDPEVVDLQLLLEQIAASAGDPPEHGLAGVAARRRRRKRHRRGAVATAMTLAVAASLAVPFLLRDDDHDVTAGDVATNPNREVQRAGMPDAVKLVCARSGIDVPVASIRPQADGLHLEVVNELPGSTRVWVRAVAEDDPEQLVWDSGPLFVERGRQELVRPVPPGVLTVGCSVGGVEQQRQVELVDADGIYKPPELACDEGDRTTLTDLALPEDASDEPVRSYVVATRSVLRPYTQWDEAAVAVTEPRGYPEQRYGSWSHQPMTEVVKDGDAVALVSLAGDDEEAPASSPWTRAPEVVVCTSFLNAEGLVLAGSA